MIASLSKPVWLAGGTLVALLSGCATATQGTSQTIRVDSDPPSAACTLQRNGQTLATVTTPGTVTISRANEPIAVTCSRDGYEEGRAVLHARYDKRSSANALLGGPLAMTIDQASGAARMYEPSVKIDLTPVAPVAATTPQGKSR
jgi:hypothetical protein